MKKTEKIFVNIEILVKTSNTEQNQIILGLTEHLKFIIYSKLTSLTPRPTATYLLHANLPMIHKFNQQFDVLKIAIFDDDNRFLSGTAAG